jgi:pimeloyl-ACP methyl ester carboxylesterase
MHSRSRGKCEAVLFIHGMPTNRRLWDGVVRKLRPHFRCFAVDLPGMGKTPFLPYGPTYFEQVAGQIEELRRHHHIERWHVVGHDGGCAAAVHYAHFFPERIGCMALLSPAIFPDLKPFFLLEMLRKPVLGEILAPLVHALFWHIAMRRAVPGINNQILRANFFENFANIAGPWKLMRLVRWGKPQILLQRAPSILRELTCPTLVIHGSRDVLPKSFAIRTADLIANAQLITLDSGHFIPVEQASRVARNLVAHFKSRGTSHAESDSPYQGFEESMRPIRAKQVGMIPVSAAQ